MKTEVSGAGDFWTERAPPPVNGYQGAAKASAERSNELLETAWSQRKEFPVPWLHASVRWRLLQQLPKAYAGDVGISHTSVGIIESPREDIGMLRFHGTWHQVVDRWKELADDGNSANAPVLQQGVELLLASLTAHARLQVNKLVLRQRIDIGPDRFDEVTDINKHTLLRRINEDRRMTFAELIAQQQALHFPRRSRRTPDRWENDRVQEAVRAFVDDAVLQNDRREFALLNAMLEFAGHRFTFDCLHHDLGVSQRVTDALINNRPVPLAALSSLLALLLPAVGPKGIELLQSSWPSSVETVEAPTQSFAQRVRGRMDELRIPTERLMEACGVSLTGAQAPCDLLRNALERGPSRKLPPASLLYLTSDDAASAGDKAVAEIHGTLTRNAAVHRREANAALPAALQVYGLGEEEVFLDTDLANFRELRAGRSSPMQEKEALARIREAGLRINALPALRTYVDGLEPGTIASALRLLAESRPGGFTTLARGGHSSAETLSAVQRGELMTPPCVLNEVFRAQRVPIPANTAVDMHLRYAAFLRTEGVKPGLGSALHAIIGRTHRLPRTFSKATGLGWPDGTLSQRLRRANEKGVMEPEHVKELLRAAGIQDDAPAATYLRLLRTGKKPMDVLPQWLEMMKRQEGSDIPAKLRALEALLAQQQKQSPASAKNPEQELRALLQRKFVLQKWLLPGETNASGRGRPRGDGVDTPGERDALDALLELPGLTKDELLAFVAANSAAAVAPQAKKTETNEGIPPFDDSIRSVPAFSLLDSWVYESKKHALLRGTLNTYHGSIERDLREYIARQGGAVPEKQFREFLLDRLSALHDRDAGFEVKDVSSE